MDIRARALAFTAAMLAACALVAAATAFAADPPAPGCAGVFATDPPGDQTDLQGDTAPANLDALAGWFRVGEDGKLTGNIRIAELNQGLPRGAVAIAWYLYWENAEGAVKYAGGSSDGMKVTWSFGTLATNRYTEEGQTTGTLVEGKDGVVQVVIPAVIAKSGDKLSVPYGDTRITTGGPVGPKLLSRADAVPDDVAAGGKTYTVNACEASAPPVATPTPTPTPVATPTPGATPGPGTSGSPEPAGQSPGGSGGQQPPSGGGPSGGGGGGGTTAPAPGAQPPAKAAKPVIRVTTRRARRSRRLVVVLRSTGQVNGLTATLRRGRSKTLARGRLARIDGTGKIRLKAKRKLRKGTYSLRLVGRDAAGARITAKARIKVR